MFKRFQKHLKNNQNVEYKLTDSDETSTEGSEPCLKNNVLKNSSKSIVDDNVYSDDSIIDDHSYDKDEQNTMRGKYKCTLCANRLLLTDQTLQDHLQSKKHLKREKQWMIEQQKKNKRKPEDKTLEIKKVMKREIQERFKQKKLLAKKKRVAELTAEQILAKKEKFRLKKERRLMKKNKEVSS